MTMEATPRTSKGKRQVMPTKSRKLDILRRPLTEEKIRRRAYEIWLARGGESGHELDDWLQAERELQGQ